MVQVGSHCQSQKSNELMITKIRSFIAYLRLCLFTIRVEREIYHRIAPQIHGHKDHGYPFGSRAELLKAALQENRDIKSCLEIIERQADHMGKAYGEAFRYVMYRDLHERLLPYVKLAQWRVSPELRIPQYAC